MNLTLFFSRWQITSISYSFVAQTRQNKNSFKMATSQRALNAYRAALRSTRIAFGNDITTLNAARNQIKQEMKSEVSATNPKLDIPARIELLEQVSVFLKRNVVQGVKRKDVEETKYTLNIHQDTELGDNEDIKVKKSTLTAGAASGGGCCGNGQIELQQKH